MRKFQEQIKRSLLKTITFRLLIVITDAIIVYIITRSIDLTIGIVLLSNILRTILFFFHERLWDSLSWGRSLRGKI